MKGLLLRQFYNDSFLKKYNFIILDEVHERNLNCDFLLGILKCLLIQRKDLHVILMSATINMELFRQYFKDIPIVKVPGRLFPIELKYSKHFCLKTDSNESSGFDCSPFLRIISFIEKNYTNDESGDILIFLSGVKEINCLCEAIGSLGAKSNKWIPLPLHGNLSPDEQNKVFDITPIGLRKCICATNIAETSITIDGIRFVIDSGKMKEMRFDPRIGLYTLQEVWISQASAEQRKGRAGRTGPGVCFRLYTADELYSFDSYSIPEIHRIPLESVVLISLSLGLNNPHNFPFIETPSINGITSACNELLNCNAVNFSKNDNKILHLTEFGYALSILPIEPQIGKILICGSLFNELSCAAIIAASLSVQSLFSNNNTGRPTLELAEKENEYMSKFGDLITSIKIFSVWLQKRNKLQLTEVKKWCKGNSIIEQRLLEIARLSAQFEGIITTSLRRTDHDMFKVEAEEFSGSTLEICSSKRHINTQYKIHKNEFDMLKRKRAIDGSFKKILSIEEKDKELINDNDIIRDLEMKLLTRKNIFKTLKELDDQKSSVIKIVISAGLYPRLAITNNQYTNNSRASNSTFFHTKHRKFLNIHPSSVYSRRPEWCSVFNSTNSYGLLYFRLLETDKPYIVNLTLVSVLHIVLLFSTSINTNLNGTKILFDEWILVEFEEGETCMNMICESVKIRKCLWDNMDFLSHRICISNLFADYKTKDIDSNVFTDLMYKYEHLLTTWSKDGLYDMIESFLNIGAKHKISYHETMETSFNNSDEIETHNIPTQIISVLKDLNITFEKEYRNGGLKLTNYLTWGSLI